ncbi:MAG: hypothetical protein ABIQ16_20245, partial [Polyangiaceae bacterium]
MKFWQVKPFSLHGYDAEDPLDWVSASAGTLLMTAVTAVTSTISLYIVYYVAHIAVLNPAWLFWVEVALFAGPYAWFARLTRKWASWVLPLLTLALIPIDLYVEAHCRIPGKPCLWVYEPHGIGALTPLLRGIIVFGGDALLHGTFCLYISRVLLAWFAKRPADAPPTWAEHDQVFRPEWIQDEVTKPKHDFGFWVFRAVSLGYGAYLVLVTLGAMGSKALPELLRGLVDQTYANPALTINTFTKIAAVCLIASLGAWNRKLRFHTGVVLVAGHGVSTIASLLFYFANPAPRVTQYHQFLLASAATDTVILILVAIAMHGAYEDRHRIAAMLPEDFSLPERASRRVFGGLALGCLV